MDTNSHTPDKIVELFIRYATALQLILGFIPSFTFVVTWLSSHFSLFQAAAFSIIAVAICYPLAILVFLMMTHFKAERELDRTLLNPGIYLKEYSAYCEISGKGKRKACKRTDSITLQALRDDVREVNYFTTSINDTIKVETASGDSILQKKDSHNPLLVQYVISFKPLKKGEIYKVKVILTSPDITLAPFMSSHFGGTRGCGHLAITVTFSKNVLPEQGAFSVYDISNPVKRENTTDLILLKSEHGDTMQYEWDNIKNEPHKLDRHSKYVIDWKWKM